MNVGERGEANAPKRVLFDLLDGVLPSKVSISKRSFVYFLSKAGRQDHKHVEFEEGKEGEHGGDK